MEADKSHTDRGFSLFWPLAIGLILREVLAFFSLGIEHPNETYRFLELIAHLQGYAVRLPWEFHPTGGGPSVLSFFFPKLGLTFLRFLARLGVHTVLGQLIALKALFAVLSLSVVWGGVRFLESLGVERRYVTACAWLTALAPEMVFQSVRLWEHTAEVIALGAILGLASSQTKHAGRARGGITAVIIGVIVVGIFLIRSLSIVWIGPLLLFLFGLRRLPVSGFCVGMAGAALASVVMCPDGFPSILHYWQLNGLENAAARYYGVAPWHRYGSEVLKFWGPVLPALVLASVPFADSKPPGRWQRAYPALWFLPLIVFTLEAHKEARFLYGFQPLFLILGLKGVADLMRPRSDRAARLVLASIAVTVMSFQSVRVFEKLTNGTSGTVRQWALLSPRTERYGPEVALRVTGDPDFLPGGFFLRTHAQLCYPHHDPCAADARDVALRLSEGRWTLFE